MGSPNPTPYTPEYYKFFVKMKMGEEKLTKPDFDQIRALNKYDTPFPKESRLNHNKDNNQNF